MRLNESNKKIAVNTIILYGRLVITTITGLICTRLLLKAFGAEDLGIFYVVAGFVTSINFLSTVLITASFRFLAVELGEGNTRSLNKVFNVSFTIHAILAIIFIIVALSFGTYYIHNHLNVSELKVEEAFWVFIFSVIGTFFAILGVPYNGLITAHENFAARATIEIIRAFARLLVVVLVYLFAKNGLLIYAFLMTFVMLISPLLYYFYCHNKYPSEVKFNLVTDLKEYKSMLSFSGWLFLGTAASIGRVQLAALIINSFFGTILNSAFGIANQVSQLVTVFGKTLSQATIPQITKNYQNNNQRSIKLIGLISRIAFYMILLLAFPILLRTEELLSLWLPEIPAYTSIFVQLTIVYALLESLHSGLPAYIDASGNIKWFKIVNSLLLLLSLPVAYILFVHGAKPFYITLCYIGSYIISRFTTFYQLKRILKFDIYTYMKKVYIPTSLVLSFLIPVFFINQNLGSGIASIILIVFVSISFTSIGIYLVGITKEERQLVNNSAIKVFKRSFRR